MPAQGGSGLYFPNNQSHGMMLFILKGFRNHFQNHCSVWLVSFLFKTKVKNPAGLILVMSVSKVSLLIFVGGEGFLGLKSHNA